MLDFKKYDIWKLNHKFTLEVYALIEKFAQTEIYGITSPKLRRALRSIPTTISEGYVEIVTIALRVSIRS